MDEGGMNEPAEFWAKVAISGVPDRCWEWQGATAGRRGEKYGQLRWGKRFILAHRLAWELTNGLIPVGLVIDHKCRNHVCVNPDHLRVTTQRDNILSGTGVAARHAAQTHCIHGHSLGDAYPRRHGGRNCRTCVALRNERTRTRSAA